MKEKREIILFFTRLLMLAVMLAVLFGVIFGMTSAKNQDMSPKICAGDLLLYYRLERKYSDRDVVVFQKEGTLYTGRIVAREKDKVEITDKNELKINGSIVNESDIFYKTPAYVDGISYPVKVKKDQYFILCDFREGAKDSRYFGAVNAKDIKGRVITVLRRSKNMEKERKRNDGKKNVKKSIHCYGCRNNDDSNARNAGVSGRKFKCRSSS